LRIVSHFKLGTKMALLLWMAVAAMVAISAIGGMTLRQQMVSDRIDKIQAAVDMAIGIAKSLEAKVAPRRSRVRRRLTCSTAISGRSGSMAAPGI
jgi:hypothetical protein